MNGIQTVDETIEQVERLYRSVTGKQPPEPGDAPYAAIPPEKDPEAHIDEQIQRLMETIQGAGGPPRPAPGWTPPLSVWQGPNETIVCVDLPGVARDSVRVRIANGLLEVSGSRSGTTPGPGDHPQLRYAEHPLGKFQRFVPVPVETPAEQLQAQIRDGVLSVRIPRPQPDTEPREVSVR